MKNKAFILLLLLGISAPILAQNKFKLGIRLAPSIAFNKVEDANDQDDINFSSSGIGLRYSAGLFGDFHFGKYYAFHSGLWFTVMRSGVEYSGNLGNGKAIYNTQQLQIPLAIKLFTNEISTDMKLYFTLGGNIAAIINEKRLEYSSDQNYFNKPAEGKGFGVAEIGLLVGAGVEYQMAESTTLFGGFVYNRGLFDPTSKEGLFSRANDSKDAIDYFKINNQLIGLEIGIKF